ncbi:uncharacterized protein [Anabrus simplex]|uniref:uncharacterized protein isoform X2 n=1 Tax=Anabrus simplex TaxID=316456 RepID=UPI0035A383A3
MQKEKGRGSSVLCCVVGCSNNYRNTTDVIFYSFPKRITEAERRKKWIQAVNRKNPDGSCWQPTPHSRICSVHFIGNRRSGHPENPAYVPTIFPKEYKKINISNDLAAQHIKRVLNRKRKVREENEILEIDCNSRSKFVDAFTDADEIKCEIEEGSIEFDESRETSGAEYSSGSCLASEVKSEPLSDGEGRNSNSDVTITPTTAPDRTSFAGVFVKEEPQSAESEMDIPVTEELNMIEVKGEPVEGTVKLEVVETMVAADSC